MLVYLLGYCNLYLLQKYLNSSTNRDRDGGVLYFEITQILSMKTSTVMTLYFLLPSLIFFERLEGSLCSLPCAIFIDLVLL